VGRKEGNRSLTGGEGGGGRVKERKAKQKLHLVPISPHTHTHTHLLLSRSMQQVEAALCILTTERMTRHCPPAHVQSSQLFN